MNAISIQVNFSVLIEPLNSTMYVSSRAIKQANRLCPIVLLCWYFSEHKWHPILKVMVSARDVLLDWVIMVRQPILVYCQEELPKLSHGWPRWYPHIYLVGSQGRVMFLGHFDKFTMFVRALARWVYDIGSRHWVFTPPGRPVFDDSSSCYSSLVGIFYLVLSWIWHFSLWYWHCSIL